VCHSDAIDPTGCRYPAAIDAAAILVITAYCIGLCPGRENLGRLFFHFLRLLYR
jgi:hypothetical protein